MAPHMPDDGLGSWSEHTIDEVHVEWRRRPYRAEEAHLGTDYVVDISIDGAPPVIQTDFNECLDQDEELSLRVRLLKGR